MITSLITRLKIKIFKCYKHRECSARVKMNFVFIILQKYNFIFMHAHNQYEYMKRKLILLSDYQWNRHNKTSDLFDN